MAAKYRLNFWFEWMADTALWAANAAAKERFNIGPIYPEKLPLSPETSERIVELSHWHDGSLNWDYPPDPGPWRQEECDRFNAAVEELLETVIHELGDDFDVINTQEKLTEDPDLDEYLKDPKNFKRKEPR